MLFVWLFVLNLLFNGIQEALHAANPDSKSEAVANVALFSLFGFFGILIFPGIVDTCFHISISFSCKLKFALIVRTWLEVVLSALCYYIGNNLYSTVSVHGTQIDCDSECQNRCRIASIALLGLSLVSAYLIPLVSKRILKCISDYKTYRKAVKKGYTNKLMKMIVEVVKIDILYTTLIMIGTSAGFVHSENDLLCDVKSVVSAVIILLACVLVGIVAELVIGLPEYQQDEESSSVDLESGDSNEAQTRKTEKAVSGRSNSASTDKTSENDKARVEEKLYEKFSNLEKRWKIMSFFVFYFIFISLFILYILADNHLPLDYVACNYTDPNRPTSAEQFYGVYIIRSVLGFVGFGIALILFIFICVSKCKCSNQGSADLHKARII